MWNYYLPWTSNYLLRCSVLGVFWEYLLRRYLDVYRLCRYGNPFVVEHPDTVALSTTCPFFSQAVPDSCWCCLEFAEGFLYQTLDTPGNPLTSSWFVGGSKAIYQILKLLAGSWGPKVCRDLVGKVSCLLRLIWNIPTLVCLDTKPQCIFFKA